AQAIRWLALRCRSMSRPDRSYPSRLSLSRLCLCSSGPWPGALGATANAQAPRLTRIRGWVGNGGIALDGTPRSRGGSTGFDLWLRFAHAGSADCLQSDDLERIRTILYLWLAGRHRVQPSGFWPGSL